MKKATVIINPKSGSDKALSLRSIIEEKFLTHFDKVEFKITEKAGDAEIFAREAAPETDAIVSVGGDGTLGEIATGLKDSPRTVPIAIIPAGTGNMVAKILGMPLDMKKAAESLDFSKLKSWDMGVVNGEKAFVYMFSLGKVPEAIHSVQSDIKTEKGIIAYVKPAIESLSDEELYELEIETQEEKFRLRTDLFMASVTTRLMLHKFAAQDAKSNDGYAHVFVSLETGPLERLSMVTDALRGCLDENKNVKYIRTKKFTVRSLKDQIITDIDGDRGPDTPVSVEILEKKLAFYLPKSPLFQLFG